MTSRFPVSLIFSATLTALLASSAAFAAGEAVPKATSCSNQTATDQANDPHPHEARVAPLPPAQWNPEQRDQLITVAKSRKGANNTGAYNMLGTVAYDPSAIELLMHTGHYTYGPSFMLTPRQREIVVLRTAWLLRSEYEWATHKPVAREAGMNDAEIERIKAGADVSGWADEEKTLLRATDQLACTSNIDDPMWKDLQARFSNRQVLNLVYLIGAYRTTAMVGNTFRVQVDKGFSGF